MKSRHYIFCIQHYQDGQMQTVTFIFLIWLLTSLHLPSIDPCGIPIDKYRDPASLVGRLDFFGLSESVKRLFWAKNPLHHNEKLIYGHQYAMWVAGLSWSSINKTFWAYCYETKLCNLAKLLNIPICLLNYRFALQILLVFCNVQFFYIWICVSYKLFMLRYLFTSSDFDMLSELGPETPQNINRLNHFVPNEHPCTY